MTTKKPSGEAEPQNPSDARAETFVVGTIEQVKALTHPLRQQILERFAQRTRTTKQVADELGEKPTRLYHHVAALERAGLIRLVETRPKRGTTEKYFAAVAERFEIDPRTFSPEGGTMSPVHPSALAVESLLDNTRAELGHLIKHQSADELAQEAVFMSFEVRGDKESIAAAREKIETLVRELQEDAPDEVDHAEVRRLLLGWYPLLR